MGHVATCPGTCTQAIRHLSDTVQGCWSVREFAWGLVPCRAISNRNRRSSVLSTYSECVGHACFPYSASCTRVGAVQGASPRALFFFAGTKCTAPPGHATRASPCLASITSCRGALGAHAREDATSLHWRAGRLSTSVHFVLRENTKNTKTCCVCFAGTKCTAPRGRATHASPCLASITSWRGALEVHAREDATSLH